MKLESAVQLVIWKFVASGCGGG